MQSDKEIEKAKMFNTKIERTCNHRYRSNFRFVRKYSMQLFIRLKECVAKNSWVYLSLSPLPFASLLFSSICKASSDNHLAFLHIFSLGMVLLTTPVQCYEPLPIILQALCLSDLIPWIYHFYRIIIRDFSSYLNGLVVFPTFSSI